MTHYGLKARLLSFHEHNKAARIPPILETLKTEDVALVSEAGAPGVSDPGRELVAEAARMGIPVVPVPGPSAVTTSLSISGFAAGRFRFLGFLSRRGVERRRMLESALTGAETIVIFEGAPPLSSLNEGYAGSVGRPTYSRLPRAHQGV